MSFQCNHNQNKTKLMDGISENIYDQIPAEPYYDAPYEMRTNDEVYEPEPPPPPSVTGSNVVTINGVSLR